MTSYVDALKFDFTVRVTSVGDLSAKIGKLFLAVSSELHMFLLGDVS